MWLAPHDVQLCAKFVFDVEFIGDISHGHEECHPWEIAVLCVDTNQKFYCPIMPQLTKKEIGEAFTSTDTFNYALLQKINAQNPGTAYRMLAAWIHQMLKICQKSTALMISHNCFASDMPILVRHMSRHGAAFVCPVMFFDSLLFCRYAFRGTKENDYSLDNLFTSCSYAEDNTNLLPHRAISDTRKLHSVLLPLYSNMSGLACHPGSLPFTLVPGIGTSTARLLNTSGIEDLQHLRHLCLQRNGHFSQEVCKWCLATTGLTFALELDRISEHIVGLLTQKTCNCPCTAGAG